MHYNHKSKITTDKTKGINVKDLDFTVMPYNSLGSIPVFESIKRNIPTYAVKENKTVLDIDKNSILKTDYIIEVETYEECLNQILKG